MPKRLNCQIQYVCTCTLMWLFMNVFYSFHKRGILCCRPLRCTGCCCSGSNVVVTGAVICSVGVSVMLTVFSLHSIPLWFVCVRILPLFVWFSNILSYTIAQFVFHLLVLCQL